MVAVVVAVAIADEAAKKIATLAPPCSPGGHLGTRDRVKGCHIWRPSGLHFQTKDGGTFCILRCLALTHGKRLGSPWGGEERAHTVLKAHFSQKKRPLDYMMHKDAKTKNGNPGDWRPILVLYGA